MSNRELFHATMRRENGDRLLHMEQGFNIIYEQWLADGLPRHVAMTRHPEIITGENLQDHMNVAGYLMCRVNQFCIPEFEGKIMSMRQLTKSWSAWLSLWSSVAVTSRPLITWHSGELPTMAIATTPGDWRSMARQTR